jgi:8-oxo-dGTP pyrophosphatase MutT (NUDIX family)
VNRRDPGLPLERLLARIDAYALRHPGEAAVADRFREFVRSHPDGLLRSCAPGHLTASACVVSSDHERVLLMHHRKLDRWLQLGGHADGDPDLLSAALREAREESGIERFVVWGAGGEAGTPLDLDVHEIPARASEPRHLHFDVRFLLVADADSRLRGNAESKALVWARWDEVERLSSEESLLRMLRKARESLGLVALPPAG